MWICEAALSLFKMYGSINNKTTEREDRKEFQLKLPDQDRCIALTKAAVPNVLAGDREEAKAYGTCTVGE